MTFKFLLKFIVVPLLATALLGMAGCKQASDSAASGTPTTPISIAAIAAEAKGFSVGSSVSARTVYVFFDAQCPHCGELWKAAKPLKSQARFVWIPVGILNPSSTSQGAALLAASDPVAAMDAHEASLLAGQGGMTAAGASDALKAVVAKNTELFNRFGFASIPTIVALNAQSGALVTQEGAMPTPALATFLGLPLPAAPPATPG
ncbi:MAG: DsbC family protein [Polaromonas sp.]